MNKQPISPVSPADYLLVRLAMVSNGKRSARQLAADLKSRLPAEITQRALSSLSRSGLVDAEGKVSLTSAGENVVRERFGALRRDRKRLETRVEPALALGMAPESEGAGRLTRPDTLRAILLTRVYGLPIAEGEVTLAQAVGSLVRRGVAGLLTTRADAALVAAAGALPDDLADMARLRASLIRLALSLGTGDDTDATSPLPADSTEAPAVADPSDAAGFARRVLDITRTAHTGPFAHKTPIAHVYDIYGRRHGDAGSLPSFKQRLLQASNAGHLALLPLDDSTAMDATTRERSEIITPTGHLHFVERDA